MAEACTLPMAVQACAFHSELPQQAVTCMQKCNQSAVVSGASRPHIPDCCGLQCLESCWVRDLANATHVDGYPNGVDGNATGANGDAATVGGVGMSNASSSGQYAPALHVALQRTPPHSFDNTTQAEAEHTNNVYIMAVLSPPCVHLEAPWWCAPNASNVTGNGTGNGSDTSPQLLGDTRKLIDPVTGAVTFDNLVISGPPGDYRVLLYATDFGREEAARRWGLLTPPNLYGTRKWPVYVSNYMRHGDNGTQWL